MALNEDTSHQPGCEHTIIIAGQSVWVAKLAGGPPDGWRRGAGPPDTESTFVRLSSLSRWEQR